MVLTLEVIGEQAGTLGADARKVFDRIGGTIGRLPDNDWVFADRYISNRHALIRYVSGKYFIEDTSTNGVFVNAPDNRLSRTHGHQLRDGDVIFIDAYKIQVSIAAAQGADGDDPLALFGRKASRAAPARSAPPPAPAPVASVVSADDIEDIDDIDQVAALDRPVDEGTQWFGLGELPEMLKQTMDGGSSPAAAGPKTGEAAPHAAVGQASGDAEAREAAMFAAMRIAFETLLGRFDPERLQDEFDRQRGAAARLRYWDFYREKYAALTGDAEAAFRTLFADEFAKAYADQLERLRSRRAGQ